MDKFDWKFENTDYKKKGVAISMTFSKKWSKLQMKTSARMKCILPKLLAVFQAIMDLVPLTRSILPTVKKI